MNKTDVYTMEKDLGISFNNGRAPLTKEQAIQLLKHPYDFYYTVMCAVPESGTETVFGELAADDIDLIQDKDCKTFEVWI